MNKILTFTLMFLLTISSVSGGIYLASTAPFIEKFETQLGQLALVNDNDMVEDKVDLDIVGEVAGVTDTSDQYAMLISVAYAQTKPICTTLSANPVSGKAPLNVRLTGSGQDELLSYKFAFGDGEEVTTLENQVTHSYLNPGTYTAVLRVVSNKVESDAVDTCKTTITVSKEVAEVLPQATVESSHLACLNLACVLVSGDGPMQIVLPRVE